jgi:hypothetical protein
LNMERMTTLQKLDPEHIPHLLVELEKYLPDSIVVSFYSFEVLNLLSF